MQLLKQAVKRRVSSEIWWELRCLKMAAENARVRWAEGALGFGHEGHIFPEGSDRVRKVYSPEHFEANEEFGRNTEWDILSRVRSPFIVNALEYDGKSLVLERLGKPLGDYNFGVFRVENFAALEEFARRIPEELARLDLQHLDLHPGQVLYAPKDEKYKLIDWSWSRWGHEQGYVLPRTVPEWGRDDRTNLRKIMRQAHELRTTAQPLKKLAELLY